MYKVCHSYYTYGLNGFKLPEDKGYLVNLLDDAHWDKVKSDIEKAEQIANFTIVLPHWGAGICSAGPNTGAGKVGEDDG